MQLPFRRQCGATSIRTRMASRVCWPSSRWSAKAMANIARSSPRELGRARVGGALLRRAAANCKRTLKGESLWKN